MLYTFVPRCTQYVVLLGITHDPTYDPNKRTYVIDRTGVDGQLLSGSNPTSIL